MKEIKNTPENQVQEQERICPACGTVGSPKANFCSHCGIKISKICPSCRKHGHTPFDCGSDKC